MRIFIIILLSLTAQFGEVYAKPFKLGANESEYQFATSNKGVIGIRFEKLHNANTGRSLGTRPVVMQVYPGTPAERSGMREGDEIISINGIRTEEFDSKQIYALLAGPPGTPVYLEILTMSPYGNRVAKEISVMRMDMNQIPSDDIFKIYKYGY